MKRREFEALMQVMGRLVVPRSDGSVMAYTISEVDGHDWRFNFKYKAGIVYEWDAAIHEWVLIDLEQEKRK